MKEKIKSLVILILLVLTIYLCFRIFQSGKKFNKAPQSSDSVITDTVYLSAKDYSKVKPYSDGLVNPNTLMVYSFPVKVKVNGSGTKADTLFADCKESNIADCNTHNNLYRLCTGPLLYDSISQIILKNNWLEITTKNTLDSTYKIRKFNIDLSKYNYNWTDNQLTYKKKLNLKLLPYIKGSYRPFNNLTDLNAGISLETRRFNYNLGLNLFYYPNLSNKIGKDLEISITYKFK